MHRAQAQHFICLCIDILATVLDRVVPTSDTVVIVPLLVNTMPGIWSLLWERCFDKPGRGLALLWDGYGGGNEFAKLIVAVSAVYKKFR